MDRRKGPLQDHYASFNVDETNGGPLVAERTTESRVDEVEDRLVTAGSPSE